MLKKIGLAVALVVAGAVPAMAQATCTAPDAPAPVDGTTATRDQLVAGITAAKAFIAASDTYQQCILDDISKQKAAATKDKPFDPNIEKAETAKGLANQADKVKVGDQINGAVGAYKKLHPG